MAKLTIDLTGKKGLAKRFYGDINRETAAPNLRYDADDGEMVSGFFNNQRVNGYIAPANSSYKQISGSGTTSDYDAVPRAFYDDYNTTVTYFAATSTRLRKSANNNSGEGSSSFQNFSSDSTSVGTTCDLEMYQVNSVRKLFVASTDKLCLYDPFSGVYDNVWSTTTAAGATSPTASDYSRIIKSDNGFMYWLLGNLVYKIDGTAAGGANGTLSLALTFPTTQYLYDGLSARGKLFIAVNPDAVNIRNNRVFEHNTSVECGIYVWDRSSAITSLSDFYPIPGITQIRKIFTAPNGEIRVLAIATNRLTVMYKFTGSEFVKVHELPQSSYPNQPKGLSLGNGVAYWLGNDGILYANYYPIRGEDYIIKLLDCNAVATSIAGETRTITRAGGILVVGRYDTLASAASGYRNDYEAILIGWRDANAGGTASDIIIRYLPHSTTVFHSVTPRANQGDVYTPVKYLPSLSTVHHATILCAPTATSGSTVIGTVKFYANQSSTPFKSESITKTKASRGYISIPLNKLYVNAIQVEIEWATDQTLGADDFCPAVVVFDYTPVKETIKSKAD